MKYKITITTTIDIEALERSHILDDIIKGLSDGSLEYELDFEKSNDGTLIRCPDCMELNTIADWNEATRDTFGYDSGKIEDNIGNGEMWFICPACDQQLEGDELEKEEDE